MKKNNKNSKFFLKNNNYKIILFGVLLIILGFLLMIGPGANTNIYGNFDKNYWNNDIFSFRRIRLSPFLILLGFIMQVFGIFYKKK